jgi:hypothetical protein
MADFYPYLMSSLPMLHFGMHPPLSSEKLLEICHGLIPENDYTILSSLNLVEEKAPEEATQVTIRQWLCFDTTLRNELVKLRATRRHIDAVRYLRHDGYAAGDLAHIALAAIRNPSVIEGERFLDQERWKVLEEFSFGHFFDLDALIVYAYKLRLLERWENIRVADKERLFNVYV